MADHLITEQMSLLDLWTCAECHGRGQVSDREGDLMRCPMCLGTGTLDFDPEDKSEIPF